MQSTTLPALEVIKTDIVPGFDLHRMPDGRFGIFHEGQVIVEFSGPIIKDPLHGMSEDDIDHWPCRPDECEDYEEVSEAFVASNFNDLDGYNGLLVACFAAGYRPEVHGSPFGHWLVHHMACSLEG